MRSCSHIDIFITGAEVLSPQLVIGGFKAVACTYFRRVGLGTILVVFVELLLSFNATDFNAREKSDIDETIGVAGDYVTPLPFSITPATSPLMPRSCQCERRAGMHEHS